MDSQTLILVVGAIVALGATIYAYLESQARTLRTRIVDVPGGLRFEAHAFSIEVQRQNRQLAVVSRSGRLIRTPQEGGAAQTQAAPFRVQLPALGLQLDVLRPPQALGVASLTPIPTGHCTLRVRASDVWDKDPQPLANAQRTDVQIENVPELVAVAYEQFAARVRVWIEKLEHRAELDRVERLRKEAETARQAEIERALEEAKAAKVSAGPLSDKDREELAALQIAKWREAAGFTGNATEVSIDAEGRVVWFVDLSNDGRITLHADKRTIHASLIGASVTSLGGELEIGVRDDYWTEEEPALRTFRVFKGLAPDQRRAWKERIELVRNSTTKAVHRGP